MNLNEIEARAHAAKERADKATPFPWEGQGKTGVDPIAFNYTFDEDYNIYPPDTTETLGYQVGGPLAVFSHPEDALFCMAACEDVPALADDVLALVERVRELEGIIAEMKQDYKTYVENHEVISVHKRAIPANSHLVEAYETDTEIVVCGEPPNENEGEYPADHDCDFMGCASLSHVVYRFDKKAGSEEGGSKNGKTTYQKYRTVLRWKAAVTFSGHKEKFTREEFEAYFRTWLDVEWALCDGWEEREWPAQVRPEPSGDNR
jgi:hypothetical protein